MSENRPFNFYLFVYLFVCLFVITFEGLFYELSQKWASEGSPTLTSTIEIEITALTDIYTYMSIYVQKYAWHPPEGKAWWNPH